MKKEKILSVALIILGIVLFLVPKVIAPVCEVHDGGHIMPCHWTGRVSAAVGILMAFFGVASFLTTKRAFAQGMAVAGSILGVFSLLIPTSIIGTCKMHTMACNVGTKPWILLISGAYIVFSLLLYFTQRRGDDERKHT